MDKELGRALQTDKTVSKLEKKIRNGEGTLKDAGDLASATGKVAARIICNRLQGEYPNGQILENDVRRIVSPVLKDDHTYIAGMTAMVIDQMYKKADIGLKAVLADYDKRHENELVIEISRRSFEDGFAW